MSSAPEHGPAEGGEGEKKAGSKLPWIIGAVVLLLGGGAGAAWYLGLGPFKAAAPGDAEASAEKGGSSEHGGGGEHGGAKAEAKGEAKGESKGGHGEKGAKGEHSGGEGGGFKALDPFIANLTDQEGQRYLKASFQLEFFAAEPPHELDTRMPQIRDLILTLISSKTFDDIRTPDGKQQLREEIIARVNQALTGDVVKNVYFTEFIVQ